MKLLFTILSILIVVITLILLTTSTHAANITVDFSTSAGVINNLAYGTNTHPYPFGYGCRIDANDDGSEDTLCDYVENRRLFLDAGLKVVRMDMPFKDYTTDPGSSPFNRSNFNDGTCTVSNYGCFNITRNASIWLNQNNIAIIYDAQTRPTWNQNSTTGFCNNASGSCPSRNYTQAANMVYYFLIGVEAVNNTAGVYVSSINEGYAVSPPFFLNNLSYPQRCNATNYPQVLELLKKEHNATREGIARYNAEFGANVKPLLPQPFTFENGSTQEQCELNFTMDMMRSYPDDVFGIHDYFNNNEIDDDNSYDWLATRQAMRLAVCSTLSSSNCSVMINGETNGYNNTTMFNNGQLYYWENAMMLLYSAENAAQNISNIQFEYMSTSRKVIASSNGSSRYYNMISDSGLDNNVTKAYEAYKAFGRNHAPGKTSVLGNSDSSEFKSFCSWTGATDIRCTVGNKGTGSENVVYTLSNLGNYNVSAAINSENSTAYTTTGTAGGGTITVPSVGLYGVVHVNVTLTANNAGDPSCLPDSYPVIVPRTYTAYVQGNTSCSASQTAKVTNPTYCGRTSCVDGT